jgi:tetratricopeptide (TPR) repeat protein
MAGRRRRQPIPRAPRPQRAGASATQQKLRSDLEKGFALHQGGRLAEAEKLYRRVLKAAPEHFDATHLLGLIRLQQGETLKGARLISQALRIEPSGSTLTFGSLA